jgi:hypothetical protein
MVLLLRVTIRGVNSLLSVFEQSVEGTTLETPDKPRSTTMRVRTASVAGTVLLGGLLCFGTVTPAAAAPCDAYSQTCPSTPPGTIGGGGTGGGTAPSSAPEAGGTSNPGSTSTPADNEGRALPFTGAELVLLTLAGGGAIAGGTMLVVAGRRRRTDAV